MASQATGSTVISQSDVDNEHWLHVVGVQDTTAGKVRLYVNGVLEAEVALAGSAVSTTSTLQIGSRGATTVTSSTGYLTNSGFEIFTGAIDEVAVYQAPLHENTIKAHYLMGIGEWMDVTNDMVINLSDLAKMALKWMDNCDSPYWCDGCDFDKSHNIDLSDIEKLASYWLGDYRT